MRFRRETILLVLTITRILGDGLLIDGFDSINDVDLGAWLRRHGGNLGEDPTNWPIIVRAIYDGCFAFAGGPASRRSRPDGRSRASSAACCTTAGRSSRACAGAWATP